ncbi:hypothetical protein FSP39_013968 [Pinctada imbricata]|uniref:Uncharacterized protein n=1 Tax=Pinctada imbricata TaxID=66713 RepID=A0AA88YEX5_PINIB|nr:hypothetical protein FSP39_013968 [Pinctada imbricata]
MELEIPTSMLNGSMFNGSSNNTFDNTTAIGGIKGPSTLKLAFDVVIKLALIIIMLGMGCTIELDSLLKHLRRPTGILIGMASQFLVLPLVTFGLAHALMLLDVAALGMMVVACCPGGSTSNIFSYWVDGDVALSVVRLAGALSVLLTLVLLSVLYPFMYFAPWNIYIGAFLLPFCGFAFGYIVSLIFGMKGHHRRTVALETGIQNFPLCMTLMTMTFKSSIFSEIALFPLLYGVTCIICSLVFALIYKIVTHISKKKESENNQRDREATVEFIDDSGKNSHQKC